VVAVKVVCWDFAMVGRLDLFSVDERVANLESARAVY
jgi:hypothetical protein